jgi:hypothetical protein
VTYPGGLAGSTHSIQAVAGPTKCTDGTNAGGVCEDDDDCPPIGRCSGNGVTVCTVEQDCPLADVCLQHDGHCEATVIEVGEFKLPLNHNECNVNAQPCSDFNPCTDGDICANGTTPRSAWRHQQWSSPARSTRTARTRGGASAAATTAARATTSSTVRRSRPAVLRRMPAPDNRRVPARPAAGVRTRIPRDVRRRQQPLHQRRLQLLHGSPVVSPCTARSTATRAPTTSAIRPTGTCYIPNSAPCPRPQSVPRRRLRRTTGTCGVPNTDPCEDGDLCTVRDAVLGRSLRSGTRRWCVPNDGNPCTNVRLQSRIRNVRAPADLRVSLGRLVRSSTAQRRLPERRRLEAAISPRDSPAAGGPADVSGRGKPLGGTADRECPARERSDAGTLPIAQPEEHLHGVLELLMGRTSNRPSATIRLKRPRRAPCVRW